MKKRNENAISKGEGIFAVIVIIALALVVYNHTHKAPVPVEVPDQQVITQP